MFTDVPHLIYMYVSQYTKRNCTHTHVMYIYMYNGNCTSCTCPQELPNTVKPMLKDHCHARPPVMKDHMPAEGPTRQFN